jgi:hypothetical protein
MPHAHVSAQMDTKTALMGTLVANFTAEIIKIMEAGND